MFQAVMQNSIKAGCFDHVANMLDFQGQIGLANTKVTSCLQPAVI